MSAQLSIDDENGNIGTAEAETATYGVRAHYRPAAGPFSLGAEYASEKIATVVQDLGGATISDTEETADRIGTELGGGEAWGSKDVDRLDFGKLEDPAAVKTYEKAWGAKLLPHRKPEWVRMKLLNPRVFDAGMTK